MIEFVFFDVGGTLIEPAPSVGAVYSRAGAPHGLTSPPGAIEDAFREVWPVHLIRRGPLTVGADETRTLDWWRGVVFDVLDRLSFSGDREAVFMACYDAFRKPEAWTVFSDVRPTLEALSASGVGMGVLSNWDLRLGPLLESLDLARFFDPIIVSSVEGLEKPDPRIFRLASERASVPPERILYVGDQLELDIMPARSLGFCAFLIDRCAPSEGVRVGRLTELLRWVETL
jgi:putative hydrolase of the HAD superfamily